MTTHPQPDPGPRPEPATTHPAQPPAPGAGPGPLQPPAHHGTAGTHPTQPADAQPVPQPPTHHGTAGTHPTQPAAGAADAQPVPQPPTHHGTAGTHPTQPADAQPVPGADPGPLHAAVPPGAGPDGLAPGDVALAGSNGPAAVVVDEPRRRLHPLSPLLSGAKSIAVIVAALSWQTLSQVGVERFALVVAVVAVGVVIFAVIGWLNTGYHVVGRELRIQDGLVWRRNRAIPLDRLQAVELRRPLLAQLTGLAELRLEVVGGGKTEAPLAYLTVKEAGALRQRLLALAGRTPGVSDPAAAQPAAAPAPERPLYRVSNRDLLISQLLTPQAFLLPVGIAFVVMQFVLEGSWTFVGIASTVTAMAGVLLQPVRRVLQDWEFRLARDPAGRLAVRYGLLETRSQIVPLHRVQSIGVTWPLLWRANEWLHMRLDIAGYAGPQSNNDKRSDRLLPVGDLPVARALVWEVLPGVDLAALATLPPPARARWLHPFALKSFGAGLTPEVFVSRSGLLTRELTMVPYARLQSVRVVQGPVQRRLRLATVYADTAGGRSGVAEDRDVAEAWWLAEQLSIRARHARGPAFRTQAPTDQFPAAQLPADRNQTDQMPVGPAPSPAAIPDRMLPGQPSHDEPGPGAAQSGQHNDAWAGPTGAAPEDDAYWRRPSRS